VHHLVRVHHKEGEDAAASLMSKLGPNAEAARELAYRLYRICDLRNRPQEALGYNALVRSWGEISGLATQARQAPTEPNMFDGE
jgi:putative DNA methylase